MNNINNVTLAYDDNRQLEASKEIIYRLHTYFTHSSQKLQVCKTLQLAIHLNVKYEAFENIVKDQHETFRYMLRNSSLTFGSVPFYTDTFSNRNINGLHLVKFKTG